MNGLHTEENKLNQRLITIQTGIIYIDAAMSSSWINEISDNKYLWGVTALILASKYIEVDDKWIKSRHLIKVSKRAVFQKHL